MFHLSLNFVVNYSGYFFTSFRINQKLNKSLTE